MTTCYDHYVTRDAEGVCPDCTAMLVAPQEGLGMTNDHGDCLACWQDFTTGVTTDHAPTLRITTEADLAARHEYAMDGGNFHADGTPHTGDDDGNHAPQEELGMRFWLIVAQRVTRLADGWTTSRQVMTFGLPADVLGITGPAHAATLAADLIGLGFDDEDLYVTCTSPDDLTFAVAISGGEVSVRSIL